MLLKNTLDLNVVPLQGPSRSIEVEVKKVGCSRNAGRDKAATQAYLETVRARGYQVHQAADICFRGRYLLTNENAIEVQGAQTSGEVEFAAAVSGGEIFITVGSDHNDRSLEEMETSMLGKVFDTAKTKQLVPGVIGRSAWPYAEVENHWDQIVLKSYVTLEGHRISYQQFRLADLLDLNYYLARCPWLDQDGSVLLGGSGPLVDGLPEGLYQGQDSLGGVVFPADFHMEMIDPVLHRKLAHGYSVLPLEEPGSLGL